MGQGSFIRAQTVLGHAPLMPELSLHLAAEVTELWHATEGWLEARAVEPPFWAFAWAGGQALARYLLDHPEVVRGKDVVDVACGGGIVALAAAKAGARRVRAYDVDPLAVEATRLNAEANGISVEGFCSAAEDLEDEDASVVTAGDVFYDARMTALLLPWLRAQAERGAQVLVGDPGRAYRPEEGLRLLARYAVETPLELEGHVQREGRVYTVSQVRT
jgi:predicted nicotinamide N-methyase